MSHQFQTQNLVHMIEEPAPPAKDGAKKPDKKTKKSKKHEIFEEELPSSEDFVEEELPEEFSEIPEEDFIEEVLDE
jgi:hypothetical protein